MPTRTILRHVESLGYVVTVRRESGAVSMEAVPLRADRDAHIARCADGDGPEEEYQAAVLLAQLIGIDVEDG